MLYGSDRDLFSPRSREPLGDEHLAGDGGGQPGLHHEASKGGDFDGAPVLVADVRASEDDSGVGRGRDEREMNETPGVKADSRCADAGLERSLIQQNWGSEAALPWLCEIRSTFVERTIQRVNPLFFDLTKGLQR